VDSLRRSLSRERQQRNEALEQQQATAEILKVISSSPSDVQPVFDTIARNTSRLCSGNYAIVTRYDGELLHLVAQHNPRPGAAVPTAQHYPRPPSRDLPAARAVLERAVVHIPHADKDPDLVQEVVAKIGAGSFLGVPMLREGWPIGAIGVSRAESGPFPAEQIELVKLFADQAVIAIENARLFNETKEALERQTATSEILRVIASTPTDTQPVFDAIVHSAQHLMSAKSAILLLRRETDFFVAAYSIPGLESLPAEVRTATLDRDKNFPSQVILDRKIVHIPDWEADDVIEFEKFVAKAYGIGSGLQVPLVRKGEGIGSLAVARETKGPFSEKEIALLQSFADQAVIAIENVRLFNETKEALERQTATAEILKVISRSPTDTQPVFDAIVESAAKLVTPCNVSLVMREGDWLHRKASAGPRPSSVDQDRLAAIYPLPFDPEKSQAARAMIEGAVVQIPDTEAPGTLPVTTAVGRAAGYRSLTIVPLMRKEGAIGAIGLLHPEPGFRLSEKQLALVRTFADQAVIAIENVRLFTELQARTEALSRSVRQLTALAEVGQAISSTLELEKVLKMIVSRAVKLTSLDAGVIYEYDEARGAFDLRASENFDEVSVAGLRDAPIRRGEGATGRAIESGAATAVPDTHAPDYPARLRELLDRQGFRAVLAVPLLREEQIIGVLMVLRRSPGPFAADIVELLGTLATQSALAIQNARLFREIEEKGRELETASRHKSQFLASMSHELRTPLNAILGFNEMIIDEVYGAVPQDMKSPLESIQSSGKHLLRLINNVLDLAKIEAGRMELALSEYSVQDTVAGVHSTLRPLATEKGLEFLVDAPADIPLAYGDPGRLAQCLLNLAGNSLKFTKEGRVAIGVAHRDGLLRFQVADTGIGIPADKIPSLFTEFKQTDATVASEYGGTGLGLSITKKFIEMHGGRIWVQSEPGHGARFNFEIPLRVAQ
jgi:signal transduction histidine kinase